MSTGNIPQKLDQPGEIFDNEMTDDIFSYVVDGKVYAAAVEEVAGHGATAEMVGHHMRIQYNPASPKHIYYGPSCSLASKLVVFVAVLATAIAIAYNVITYRQ